MLVLGAVAGSSTVAAGPGVAAPGPVSWPVPGWPPAQGAPDPHQVLAAAEASRLLGLVAVAPGWRLDATAPSSLLAGPMSYPATPDLVDVALVWSADEDAASALSWIAHHPPAGSTVANGPDTDWRNGVMLESAFDDTYPSGSDAFESEQVDVAVVPLAGGAAGVRADAQVIWYPTRPAAETVPPGERHVVVAVSAGSTIGAAPAVLSVRTLTDPVAVAELATKVDGMALQVPGARSCPAGLASSPRLTLVFAGAAGVPEVRVVDDTGGCGEVTFAVGRTQEPALVDGGLFHLVDRLLGVSLAGVDTPG